MRICFGIDYGTTVSTVSYIESDNIVKHLLDVESIVTMYDDHYLVGIKDSCSNNIVKVVKSPKMDLAKNIEYTRLIFRYIYSRIAEFVNQHNDHGNEYIYDCVLTVPVIYNHCDRNLLESVCEEEKLKILRFVSEPTAAFLGYMAIDSKEFVDNTGFATQFSDEGLTLMYDLGGGTLDISLIEKYEDTCEVIWSDGNRSFGSEQLTNFIAKELVVSEREAETIKRNFTTVNTSGEYIDNIKLHSHINEWLTIAMNYLKSSLQDIVEHRDIVVDNILFTGGGTLFSGFQELLTQYCSDNQIRCRFSSDYNEMKYIISGSASGKPQYANSLSIKTHT